MLFLQMDTYTSPTANSASTPSRARVTPLIMERVSVQVLIPDRKQRGTEKDTYDHDSAPRGARPEVGQEQPSQQAGERGVEEILLGV